MTAFYTRDGNGFIPSELTRGPWDPGAQHAGPPAGLLGRAIESCEPAEGSQIGRVTFEILRPVPLAPLSVAARVARPGRSVELLEAWLSADGEELMRASAWRLRTEALALPESPGDEEPPPGPEHGEPGPFFPTGQDVGYHTAMEYRFLEGGFLESGPAAVWMRMRVPLVADEPPSPLVRVLVAADAGNGVSGPLDFRRFVFINTELSVHLQREAVGEWVCLDAVTRAGGHGIGLTETVLWDERGRVGRAAQTLLIRER